MKEEDKRIMFKGEIEGIAASLWDDAHLSGIGDMGDRINQAIDHAKEFIERCEKLLEEHTSNAERAARAANTLDAYKRLYLGEGGPVDRETWADLLTDLLHLAKRDGIDLNEQMQAAVEHFRAEDGGKEDE